MYIVFVVLIMIASVLMILAVLAQNPKSGMAANFGAGNQVMGVRQTSDFLEKFTWGLAITIVLLSLVASIAMNAQRRSVVGGSDRVLEEFIGNRPAQVPTIPMTVEGNENTDTESAAVSVEDTATEE